jgi:cytochrome c peroxidase
MNCHSQIWTNAQLLEPVRASYRTGQSLQWTRVNQLPDFVFFNHSIHINKGVGCNTCHGPVDQMPLMYQQESLQMEWCLGCHRAPEKNLRPRDQVFNMRYQQPTSASPVAVDGQSFTDQIDLGSTLLKKYNVRSVKDITSCSTCHR